MRYAKVNSMFKKIIFLAMFILIFAPQSFAFWMWTPETNEWVNPKSAVKDSPPKQLTYAKEFFDAKEYKKARDEFNKLIRYYPKSKEAPEAEFYIGLSWEAEDRLYDAFKAYQQIIERYPFSERSPEVVKKEYDLGNRMLEGSGKKGLVGGIFGSAVYDVMEVFRTVIKNAPYGEYAAPAQYKMGLFLKERQLYQEARDEFEKVISDYPNSEWAKAAKYQIALSDAKRSTDAQYDQKVTKAAVDEFKEFVKQYPDAQLSQEAQDQIHALREKEAQNNFVIAQFYEKQKNYKAAKVYYATVMEDYHASPWAPRAAQKLQELNDKL